MILCAENLVRNIGNNIDLKRFKVNARRIRAGNVTPRKTEAIGMERFLDRFLNLILDLMATAITYAPPKLAGLIIWALGLIPPEKG